jgi:hypothetical protein
MTDEAILSEEVHKNVSPITNGWAAMAVRISLRAQLPSTSQCISLNERTPSKTSVKLKLVNSWLLVLRILVFTIYLFLEAVFMPFTFSNAEYDDTVYVNGFCDGSAAAAVVENRKRFPNCRNPDRRVFIRIFNTFREAGTLPSIHVPFARQGQQDVAGERSSIGRA